MMAASTPRIHSAIMPSSFTWLLLVCALLFQQVVSHEHHDEKIPEGEAVSPDSIVRPPDSLYASESMSNDLA